MCKRAVSGLHCLLEDEFKPKVSQTQPVTTAFVVVKGG
jgi:hypothetical protein